MVKKQFIYLRAVWKMKLESWRLDTHPEKGKMWPVQGSTTKDRWMRGGRLIF
jgi:hypothetical protein